MRKNILSIMLLTILMFILSSCGDSSQVVENPVPQVPTIDYGQYAKIEIEEKDFTWHQLDLIYTNKTFPTILENYKLILSTSEEIYDFPEIYDKLTIKNTNPQLIIIPKYFQIQYSISDITCKNGIITINYETTNNIKIDKVIGQIYNVPYSIYYIDLGILPNGKYRVEFVDKGGKAETVYKDLNIFIPELITSWEVKNINYAGENFITYSSNKTGNWEIYRYDLIAKTTTKVSSNLDSPISGYNDLGFQHNNINIPIPKYNKNLNSIYFAKDSEIYRYEDLGDNYFRKFTISLKTMQENLPNSYYLFENDPKMSISGYKYLYSEISDPAETNLFLGETFDTAKKRKIQLPLNGKVEFFDWGRTENECLVVISPNANEFKQGNSVIYLLKDLSDTNKNIKITTNGYKINSLSYSNDKKFIIFSQKLASTESELNYDLYYANVNNTNQARITPKDDLKDINPSISPNDNLVAYMSSADGINFTLFIANIDGTNRHQVSSMYITDTPYWLNNEEVIVVDSFANIFKVNILSGDNELLLDGYDKLDIEAEQIKLDALKTSN